MDYKNNSNTGLIIVADCMLLSVEYIGNVHLFFNIDNMWKSISEKRQCSAKNRHNAQHNKHKSIRCATKRIKARPAALTTRMIHDTGTIYYT